MAGCSNDEMVGLNGEGMDMQKGMVLFFYHCDQEMVYGMGDACRG